MINHARTLLLNVRAAVSYAVPGEEYIEPEFTPVVLPPSVLAVRRVLFGRSPDRHMLNYRAAQLLTLIDGTPMAPLIHRFDERLTYRRTEVFFPDTLYGPKTYNQTVPGGATTELAFIGEAETPDDTGRMLQIWDVVVDTGNVTTTRRNPLQSVTEATTYSGGLSGLHTFPGSKWQFRLRESTFSPGQGPKVRVELLQRPTFDVSQLAAKLEGIGQEATNDLFSAAPEEPLKTLRNVWFDHPLVSYRVAALVLATIIRTEAAR